MIIISVKKIGIFLIRFGLEIRETHNKLLE